MNISPTITQPHIARAPDTVKQGKLLHTSIQPHSASTIFGAHPSHSSALNKDHFQAASNKNHPQLNRQQQSKLSEKRGNQYQIQRQFNQAIRSYGQAIKLNPANTNAIYNLAHTLVQSNQQKQSLPWFEYLLKVAPHDHQARAEYAEQLETLGHEKEALEQYETILTEQPNYEPAMRRHEAIHFKRSSKMFGAQAQAVQQYKGQQKLNLAIQILNQFLTHKQQSHRLNILKEVNLTFEPTVVVDNVANVAEYDHSTHPRPTIRFSEDMAFSHPDVIAAYLLHEIVHAEDKDPLTSIQEEQDAYREKTQFWQWRNSTIREPNLDFAQKLYEQSPQTLDSRVASYYKMRDPSIPETSPHHGQTHHFLSSYLNSQ